MCGRINLFMIKYVKFIIYLSFQREKEKIPPTKKPLLIPSITKEMNQFLSLNDHLRINDLFYSILFHFTLCYTEYYRSNQQQNSFQAKNFYLKKNATQNHPLENIYLFYVFFSVRIKCEWDMSWINKSASFFFSVSSFFFICVFVDSRGEHEETWG